jgi:hypothetical protein
MMTTTTTPPTWAGWVWAGWWQKGATASTIARAGRLLEAEGVRHGIVGKHQA